MTDYGIIAKNKRMICMLTLNRSYVDKQAYYEEKQLPFYGLAVGLLLVNYCVSILFYRDKLSKEIILNGLI